MTINGTQIELLRKLLRMGANDRVARIMEKFRPADIAEVFVQLSPAEQKQLGELLFERRQAANTLVELPEGILQQFLTFVGDERVGQLLDRMPPDDAVAFVSLLEEERVEAVLRHVSQQQRERIEHLRTYPPESAGQLMTSDMVTIQETMTAEETIRELRRLGEQSEFIFYVYVVNEARTFLGVVPIRRLISAPAERLIRDVMVANPVAVYATDDQEKVAEFTARYNLLAVPVVDEQFRLLGVVTVDDVIDVMQAEATEDMYLMQGLSGEDRAYSPMGQSIRKRFPWMVLNLGTAFLAAGVVGMFEESIAQLVVLATFMPIVAGMGGNTGTQTLTVITRGIALGELQFEEGMRAVGKQLGIGVIVGAGIGTLTGGIAWIWKGNPGLGLVLFMAMLLNMAIAGMAGAAVPLVLQALNLDPALGGGVIVTTFTDVFGFLIFLGLATAFMGFLL